MPINNKRNLTRHLTAFLTLFAMLCALLPTTVSFAEDSVPSWNGTADETWYNTDDTEFTITTPEQLAGLAQIVNRGDDTFYNKTINLANDIELGTNLWKPIGFYNPNSGTIRAFRGTFNGNGHSVRSIIISFTYPISGNSSMYCSTYGLFGRTFGAKIDGLVVDVITYSTDDAYIRWYQYFGGIVGDAWGNSRITNCYVTGDIIGGLRVGGICGKTTYATIDHCYNDATVETRAKNLSNDNGYVGGIVGSAGYGSITNCCNAGDVKGTGTANKVGGIAAGNGYEGATALTHSIENCYNIGKVSTTNGTIGGLVGSNGYSGVADDLNHSIINSYTNGEITYDSDATNYAGDLIGHTFHGWAFKSYWLNPGVDIITGWDNTYWDGQAEGLGYFTSNSSTVKTVSVTQSGVSPDGDSGKTLLNILDEERSNHNGGNSVAPSVSTSRAYLPWTTSAAGVNNGYPVFDYPITVKYKYEGDANWSEDSTVAYASSATAAAGDNVTVSAADGEEILSMYGKVKSPVDIGAYTDIEYNNYSIVNINGSSFEMPAFDTTIYVTLKKNEPTEWLSALIYDFPTETVNGVEYNKIELITGTDTNSDYKFNATIGGEFTYSPSDPVYEANGSRTAATYWNGTGYDNTERSASTTAARFGKTYLFTTALLLPSDSYDTGWSITFYPSDSTGENKGNSYTWRPGDKYLTEAN